MKLAWQMRFHEASAEAKGTARSGDADKFPVQHKDDDSVDKPSWMKDAIFGHKLAYGVKNNKNPKSNMGREGGGEMNSLHLHE